MKKILILSGILSLAWSQAQKIKTEVIAVKRPVEHLLVAEKTPIDISFVYKMVNSTDHLIQNNMGYLQELKINQDNPKYTAVVEFNDEVMKSSIQQFSNYEYSVSMRNTATMYLVDNSKGIIATEKITLLPGENTITVAGNGFSGIDDSSRNVAISNSNVAYNTMTLMFDLTKKELLPSLKSTFLEEQKYRLSRNAQKKILNLLTDQIFDARLEYNYVKKTDDFSAPDFDKAMELVRNHVKPVDKNALKSAIELFDSELKKTTDLSKKENRKYKEALLENIFNTQYIIDDFSNSDFYTNEMNNLNPKSNMLSWYLSEKQKSDERNSIRNKGINPNNNSDTNLIEGVKK